jgi:hypothetical protein
VKTASASADDIRAALTEVLRSGEFDDRANA